MASAAVHLVISRRFIQQAGEELDSGDLLQASEKAWGAVAHRLKAIAIQRNWPHGSHRHFNGIVDGLAEETNQGEQLNSLYSRANSLHVNFYEAVLTESQIRQYVEDVKAMLETLASVA